MNESDTLLEVRDLKVHFTLKKSGMFAPASKVYAVDGVSFNVKRGSAYGIVGESGCGKSTTALALAQLIAATGGDIILNGTSLAGLSGKDLKEVRKGLQMIFQDPYSSLDPRQRVEDIIAKPMRQLTRMTKTEIANRVDELIAKVGLRTEQKKLFPHQFSGGQRQRIGIARALAVHPQLVICDEPVSALDVAIQAQVINLLKQLQEDMGLTYLFISHDLAVVQHLCDALSVMYLGRVVEQGERKELFSRPLHPYTYALLTADPVKDPTLRGKTTRLRLEGDPPSPLNPPPGCHFHTRCPYAQDICRTESPPLRDVGQGQHVACHLVTIVDGQPVSPVPAFA
ncbi:ABC transporter ATP-binding protein [Paralcaligenes ureilyticus]|uniref:Peptide/nickel transport system ATP-binding protein/oligopeptide transport system ATP-binding protein n=1 Tax=Paralcaligenes ureilyticus TaxID=627131 RepID=A0A4R3M8P1_9BURK|nr:oligopeptide/dipeptide ABC transporter ATP-binding protein [Paralcaligenes ureilyticus]TCT09760.1 peptide/nickel transport system ATP-binding protein/oligopeptide transport system ATP-binding protein [Paralcaligenes ureilyticus]